MPDVLRAAVLGPMAFAEGVRLQEALVAARAAGTTGDWLLFPDHPPVFTVGRSADEASFVADREAIARRGAEVHEVSRGGDVTWHGPGQLVGYPIVDLARCGRDLHAYLRTLEDSLMDVLASWGIQGERVAGKTGVWTGGEKIASIGIAVRRWVGYHGFALNVAPDLAWFDLIHPCGLRGIRMTSMAERLGAAAPGIEEVRARAAEALARRLNYERVEWTGTPEPGPDGGFRAAVVHSPRRAE
uniref:Octanoyltransferase n=1 Tax=Eiseniibacteriota bacterium TaxID=2212470 RepID=A0A832MNE1_UNCEI